MAEYAAYAAYSGGKYKESTSVRPVPLPSITFYSSFTVTLPFTSLGLRTYRQSRVTPGSKRRNRDICLSNNGHARKYRQMSRVQSNRDKILDAACFIFASRVPVNGRDGCDFAFFVIEFRETDSLFNCHQAIYDNLSVVIIKTEIPVFSCVLGAPTPFFSSNAIAFPTYNCVTNKQELFTCVLFKEKYKRIGFSRNFLDSIRSVSARPPPDSRV